MRSRVHRKRKGLSPVIAEVILIAVTVAIAVAAGGYFFGLFGTQTAQASVTVINARIIPCALTPDTICPAPNSHVFLLDVANSGGIGDSLSTVTIPGIIGNADLCNTTTTNGDCGESATADDTYVNLVPANTGLQTVKYQFQSNYVQGQIISLTVRMASGLTIPVAVSIE